MDILHSLESKLDIIKCDFNRKIIYFLDVKMNSK